MFTTESLKMQFYFYRFSCDRSAFGDCSENCPVQRIKLDRSYHHRRCDFNSGHSSRHGLLQEIHKLQKEHIERTRGWGVDITPVETTIFIGREKFSFHVHFK